MVLRRRAISLAAGVTLVTAAAAAAAAATVTSRKEGAGIDALEAKLGPFLEKAFVRSLSGEPRPTAFSSTGVLGRAKGDDGAFPTDTAMRRVAKLLASRGMGEEQELYERIGLLWSSGDLDTGGGGGGGGAADSQHPFALLEAVLALAESWDAGGEQGDGWGPSGEGGAREQGSVLGIGADSEGIGWMPLLFDDDVADVDTTVALLGRKNRGEVGARKRGIRGGVGLDVPAEIGQEEKEKKTEKEEHEEQDGGMSGSEWGPGGEVSMGGATVGGREASAQGAGLENIGADLGAEKQKAFVVGGRKRDTPLGVPLGGRGGRDISRQQQQQRQQEWGLEKEAEFKIQMASMAAGMARRHSGEERLSDEGDAVLYEKPSVPGVPPAVASGGTYVAVEGVTRPEKAFSGEEEGEGGHEVAEVHERRSVQESGGTTQVQVVVSTGDTSSDWNGALYSLAVGTAVEGQSRKSGTVIDLGSINEGESSPVTFTYNLERGCYVIYTSSGTRPFDVVWQVETDGDVHQATAGGGLDWHSFGVGGALCDLSTCYRACYEEDDEGSVDECASFGDLLAPSTEPAGANCTCSAAEELDLRLECLDMGCDDRSQCYLVSENAEEITSAGVLRIVSYVTMSGTVYKDAAQAAVAEWLDFDTAYVELVLVDGQTALATTSASGVRRLGKGVSGGGGEGEYELADEKEEEFEQNEEGMFFEELQTRRLQSTSFKRLEFKIVGYDSQDFVAATATLREGVKGFNAVLATQQEDTGLSTAEAHTAEYTITSEKIAVEDMPEASIAGSGGGTSVDQTGGIVEATQAPAGEEDFTKSAQFLVGAGLVVVVSFFLSIIACIVCHMKRKERKEFVRKNATEDGQPKAVQYVDPWGSVASTFRKDPQKDGNVQTSNGSSSTA